LRWAELAGLQRADIDCDHKTVRVARQLCEVAGRQPFLASPKSDAGKRTVSMPSLIVADVSAHLESFTRPGADALVFTSPASRAALIYLHSTSARQHHLADAVTARARTELGTADEPSDAGVARTWHDPQSANDDTP
jgi:hypothetical protein